MRATCGETHAYVKTKFVGPDHALESVQMVAFLFWPEAQKSFYVDFLDYKGLQQKLEVDLLLPLWLSH